MSFNTRLWRTPTHNRWIPTTSFSHHSPRISEEPEISLARSFLAQLDKAGLDYDEVVETLESEGVQKFADSFGELCSHIKAKYAELA